ncbi:uncharacterized protein LOC143033979 [Oratosquilla oratoria]|uniref:uncharacterized protein LOC143033979 n=1 Tax=Oratosquilla oratoria TaxID=337810 RepID=UPI003F7756CA
MGVTVVNIPDDDPHWYEKIQQQKNKNVPCIKENPRPLQELLLQLCESGCYVGHPSAFFQQNIEDSVQIILHRDADGSKIHSQAALIHHVKQKPYFKMFIEALEKEKLLKKQRYENCHQNRLLNYFREECEEIEQRPREDYKNLSESLVSVDQSLHQELKIIPISDLCDHENNNNCSQDLQIIDQSRIQRNKITTDKSKVIKKLQHDPIISSECGGCLGSLIFDSDEMKPNKTFITSDRLYKMHKDEVVVNVSSNNEDIMHALVLSSFLKGNTIGSHGRQENSNKLDESGIEERGLIMKIPNLPVDVEKTDHTPRYRFLTGFEDRPWACNYCKGRFTTKNCLKQHLKTHTGQKPYECDVCLARFREQAGLKRHKMTHTGEKPFKCHKCDKAYTEKAVLIEHQRTHTGEKPYLCHICSKHFSYLFSFKQHMKRHSGERDHECEVCDAKFYTATSLATHKKKHIGLRDAICEVCGKAFIDKSLLKRHMKIHSGVKSFMCHVCDASFYRRDALNVHMRKHTSEKPFSCSICKKKFSDRKIYHVHVKKHEEEPKLAHFDNDSQAVIQGTSSIKGSAELNEGVVDEYEVNLSISGNYETSREYLGETSKTLSESYKNSHEFKKVHVTQRNSVSPKHQQESQKCTINMIDYPSEYKHTLSTGFHHQMVPYPRPVNARYPPEHRSTQDASKCLTDPQKYLQEFHRYQQLQDHHQQQDNIIQEHQQNRHLLPQHQQQQIHQSDSHKHIEHPSIKSAAAGHFQPNLRADIAHRLITSAPSEPPQGYFQNHCVWTSTISPSNLAWGGSTMWRQGSFGGH